MAQRLLAQFRCPITGESDDAQDQISAYADGARDAAARPHPHRSTAIDPAKTAHIVVDLQNGFTGAGPAGARSRLHAKSCRM